MMCSIIWCNNFIELLWVNNYLKKKKKEEEEQQQQQQQKTKNLAWYNN